MSDVITIEAAELAYDAHCHEDTLARLGGRRKFAGCRECGSMDGMQAVHHETLNSMPAEAFRLLDTLYYRAGNSTYLFYACHHCNRDKVIPDDLSALGLDDILCWINIGRPRPGCAALAAEEPALATLTNVAYGTQREWQESDTDPMSPD